MTADKEDPGFEDFGHEEPRSNVRFLWEKALQRTDKGAVIKSIRNIALILENATEMQDVIAFDDFANRLVAVKNSPAGAAGPWTDSHDLAATVWLQGAWVADASDDLVARAVHAVAAKHRCHPLREKLSALTWDGTERIATWTSTYLGADDIPVHRVYGTTWLLGAIARAFQPGVKVDAAMILEGPQGAGKSTALKILSLGFFSDELADIGSKDAALQVQGAWLHEIAELDAFGRVEMSRVKSFLTRTHDRFRPPYGRHIVELARQCVFAGSVNHSDWLTDETGGRRFLPIRVGDIDLAALRRDVEQLWAETIVRFKAGDLTYAEDCDEIRRHVALRYRMDAWHDVIVSFVSIRESTSVDEVLDHLGVERARRGQSDCNRVAKVLKFLGHERFRSRDGSLRPWRYRLPTKQQTLSEL